MKATASQSKTKQSLPKVITSENIHLFPKNKQKAFKVLQKHKDTIIAPEKYLPAQKDFVIQKTKDLLAENSELSLKLTVISVLKTLPDFLPADNLIQVVKYISETWESNQTTSPK